MKRFLFSFFVLALLCASACKKNEKDLGEGVSPQNGPNLLDTTFLLSSPSPKEPKRMLFELLSGVRSPTAPKALAYADSLAHAFPDRVSIIVIHPGQKHFVQAAPFKQNGDQDLNTTWATEYFTQVPKPNGIPTAFFDRYSYSAYIGHWDSLAVNRLQKNSTANIKVRPISYDENKRELLYELEVEVTEDYRSNFLFFSTAVTESKIIGGQENTMGLSEDFEHNYILRDFPQFVQPLDKNSTSYYTPGRVYIKQFIYTLNEDWKPENCEIVALVNTPVEVIQVAKSKIK